MSLSVVYVEDTGHVVGAVALTGASPGADVASLVGPELPLRLTLGSGNVSTLSLPDKRLAVLAADDEPGVFAEPLSFGIEPGPDKPKPTLVRLAPWDKAFVLTADTLTVNLQLVTTRITPIMVLISGDPETHLFIGEIPAGEGSAEFQVSLTRGDEHAVLVLVEGQAGRFEAVTVQ
jgi:hypothetical protein